MIILVFIFIFLVILIIMILILYSKIQIEIRNLKFSSQNKPYFNNSYKIIIKLYILSIIPLFRISITEKKIKKLKGKLKKVETKVIEESDKLSKNIFKAIKKLNINIKYIDLKIKIGTENAGLTSIIVPALSTVIAILLRKKIKDYKNQRFLINPVYINQNLINIAIYSIFEIKMIHIIDSLYVLNKKEGEDKYERTSNRRTYDDCYE